METIKALVAVLVTLSVVMLLAPAWFPTLISRDDARRLFRLMALTLCAAFLLPNFWAFILAMCMLVKIHDKPHVSVEERDTWRLQMFMALVFSVSCMPVEVPTFGIVGQLISLSHQNCLVLLLLFMGGSEPRPPIPTRESRAFWLFLWLYLGGSLAIEVVVLGYELTWLLRSLAGHFVNEVAFLLLILRYHHSREHLVRVLTVLAVVGVWLGVLAVAEFLLSWSMHRVAIFRWGLFWRLASDLERDGFLRAKGTMGQPLALAGLSLVLSPLAAGLRHVVKARLHQVASLVGGNLAMLMASLSRGGMLIMGGQVLLQGWLGRHRWRNVFLISLAALVSAVGLAAVSTSFQRTFARLLGQADAEEVRDYREMLLESGMALVQQSPWTGVPNFMTQLEHLRQGEGIIDLVNTYLAISLSYGMPVALCFLLMTVSLMVSLWRLRSRQGEDGGYRAVTDGLLLGLLGLAVFLYFMSYMNMMQSLLFISLGLGVGWIRAQGVPPPAKPRADDGGLRDRFHTW
ncbi:O-antigen ligase family protein [Ideonella livida]|uniref:O-antigen ligase family protein n=1 Tax=Ideonella livida TaxID=2707176 RepID=A0A7C9PHG7_9BURK|nr:O-antigen ligase family protein [Ideonella livida]NDY91154.1 O-antigen ligase family protein [Ideonella livida]